MHRKYRFGFDLWGLLLFLAVMAPNFIWFAVPAPVDILRREPAAAWLDGTASVCQVLLVAALCLLVNRSRPRLRPAAPLALLAAGCCLLYYLAWGFYYGGSAGPAVILALSVFPCLAFLSFAAERRNGPAVLFTILFAVCHVSASVLTFL